jgi:hypothetical protein
MLSMLLFSFALYVAVLAQTDSDEEPDYQSRLDRVTDGPYLIWPSLLEEADRTSVAVVPKFDEDGQILEEYGMGFITWEAADAMCRRPAPAPAPAAAVAATPAQAEPAAEAKPLSRAQQRRRPAAKKPQGLKKGFFKTDDAAADLRCIQSNDRICADGATRIKISAVRPCSGIYGGRDRMVLEKFLGMGVVPGVCRG